MALSIGDLVKRTALLVVALGVSAAAAEGALRLVFGGRDAHYVWPPHVRSTLHPDPANLPGVSGEAAFTTNSLGLRGPEPGVDGGEYRILVVGGSTATEMYHDDSEAWPSLVRQSLDSTADGKPVWVASAGRSGLNIRDNNVQVTILPRVLPKVDAVVALVGANDAHVALGFHGKPSAPPLSDPATWNNHVVRSFAVIPYRLSTGPWFKRTALYELARRGRRAVETIQHRAMLQDDRGAAFARWRAERRAASHLVDSLPSLEWSLEEYRGHVRRLVEAARAWGVRPIIMTQPMLWREQLDSAATARLWTGAVAERDPASRPAGNPYYTPGAMRRALDAFNAVALDECRALGAECLDLAAAIPADTVMFFDHVHFTEAGSRRVAAALADYLRSRPPFVSAATPARPSR